VSTSATPVFNYKTTGSIVTEPYCFFLSNPQIITYKVVFSPRRSRVQNKYITYVCMESTLAFHLWRDERSGLLGQFSKTPMPEGSQLEKRQPLFRKVFPSPLPRMTI
jgi:hypothetical protein